MKRERENKTNLNQKDIEGGFFIIAILGKYKDREREREKWRETDRRRERERVREKEREIKVYYR